jgi:hypothetical protein
LQGWIEYGFEGKVSIKSEVYSYGMTLLEMITRKKSTDNMFVRELTMRQWINASLPDKMMKVVDDGLLRTENRRDVTIMQSVLSSIMELGLRCFEELPDERVDIKDVLDKLKKNPNDTSFLKTETGVPDILFGFYKGCPFNFLEYLQVICFMFVWLFMFK